MCELINKDYPDFVNLSTNLVYMTTCFVKNELFIYNRIFIHKVDLNKGINDLKNPLETIKSEVDVRKNFCEGYWISKKKI